jgi:aspartate racemase
MIGIVGGIGPMAGIDLYKKIVENTLARADQEHLPVLLASLPNEIADRTTFLLGKSAENPAAALAKVILLLSNAGASHVGIACNTAHAPQIFEPMLAMIKEKKAHVEVLNMIDLAVQSIQSSPAKIKRIGLLSTTGTYKTEIYQNRLKAAGLVPVLLDYDTHESLPQTAIYEIKAAATHIPQLPVDRLNKALGLLQSQGAEGVVLGCTELGMIEDRLEFQGLEAFNPNLILARALIQKTFPKKLSLSHHA